MHAIFFTSLTTLALHVSGAICTHHQEGAQLQRTAIGFMIYIYILNRSWADTRCQQYITHLHTNSTHNTEKGKSVSAGRAGLADY
jgi:hypothetical protein